MIACPSCTNAMSTEGVHCTACGFAPAKIDGFTAWAPDMTHAGGGFKAESFEHLSEVEASNFWFRARNALIIWILKHYAPEMSSFLELGCGTGYVLSGVAEAFPHARLVGSEIFTAGLAHASKRLPAVELVQMDARHIPYVEEFDVAVALDVIEHIAEDEQVIGQLFQAVKPGGIVLISVPQHKWLWSQADDYACHVRRYTASDLHSKIRAAGFEIIRSTSFVSVLLPLMLASRLLNRMATDFDPRREFETPRAVNFILEKALACERIAIRAGVNFPAGGSRFVIAKKLS